MSDNRISYEDLQKKIKGVLYATGDKLVSDAGFNSELAEELKRLTLCVIITEAGFFVSGQSAPVDPENFDAAYGQKLAYDDAIRRLFRLEGYLLKSKMAESAIPQT